MSAIRRFKHSDWAVIRARDAERDCVKLQEQLDNLIAQPIRSDQAPRGSCYGRLALAFNGWEVWQETQLQADRP